MKLIIDIDEQHFELLKMVVMNGMGNNAQKIIAQGIPLPKEHGRLIDADELKNEYCESNCGQRRCDKGGCMWIDSVKIAPTIIKADKAESEDEE